MTTETRYYSIQNIDDLRFTGFQYTLPKNVLEILQNLENELQITNVDIVETTGGSSGNPHKKYNDESKSKRHGGGDHRNYRNQKMKELTNDDWEMIRSFKTTKIEKKEGVEKSINNIRILLNKISNKNYDTQKIVIIDSVAEFLQETTGEGGEIHSSSSVEDIEKITQSIFDIVSSNKFFSEIYANLYKELIDRFDIFDVLLKNYIHTYKISIDEIHFVDPNKDYDGFCSYTKINDNRRAMTLFIINMYKIKVLQEELIVDILQYFILRTLEYIDSENRSNELEEITENIFLIISNIQTQIVNNPVWNNDILPNIWRISQMKFKEHKSLSNRVIFKYMDIIESIEN